MKMEESQISSETKRKCLVANDCPMQLMAMSLMLERMGFEVDQVMNGYQALQLV